LQAANTIWQQMRGARGTQPPTHKPRNYSHSSNRKSTRNSRMDRGEGHKQPRERPAESPRQRRTRPPRNLGDTAIIAKWGSVTWKRRREDARRRCLGSRAPVVWSTPWTQDPRRLYAGLSKADATALFLMCTEVIGLNAWLAAVHVSDVFPMCSCTARGTRESS
jgi:hypothetical protein